MEMDAVSKTLSILDIPQTVDKTQLIIRIMNQQLS
jgi:hypothetical protein